MDRWMDMMMKMRKLFSVIGAGVVYNTIAIGLNNMIFETAGIDTKIMAFDTKFMCPMADATELTNLDIITDNKWDILFAEPTYKIWCVPSFMPRKTIIYNIDEYARENKLFVAANIRIIS